MAFDNIKQWIATKFGAAADGKDAGTGLQRAVTPEMAEYDRMAVRNDRLTKIQECTQMGEVDPRIARMYYKLRSDSCVNGFAVNVETAPDERTKGQAQGIIDGTKKRCEIDTKLKGWVNGCIRDGDSFLEVVVDEASKEIIRLKKLAASITQSSENAEGNFPENEPAYYQSHPFMQDQKIKTFEAWQIVHLRWNYEDGKPYGNPLFAAARLAWKRLDSAEKNIVVRRAMRAGLRLHHKIGNPERPDWQQVLEYKKNNQDTLDNPMSPSQDFFSTGNVEIAEIDGDRSIGDMIDVNSFEGLLFMIAGIPEALMGGGREKGVNRDVLDEQEEDYYRVIEDINDLFEQGLRQVFDFALMLQGINPESIEYTFNWGAKDREDVDAKIARGKELQALGLSFETVFGQLDLDGVTYEEEIERIRKQIAEGIVPYGLGAKLDPVIAQLLLGVVAQQRGAAGGSNELLTEISKLRELAERQLGPGEVPLKVVAKQR